MRIPSLTGFAALALLTACNTAPTGQSSADQKDWIELFNGKNMDGWTVKFKGEPAGVNYRNTFQVEDGLLRARYNNWDTFNGEFGHIVTDNSFAYYLLEVEYRFVDEQVDDGPEWAWRNNGMMYHSQSAEQMGLEQDFPVSMEYQLLGGNGTDDRSTANLCTPGTRFVMNDELRHDHCLVSDGPTFHGDQWVTLQLRVHGSELAEHIVGGEVVMRYTNLQYSNGEPLGNGHIALQAETHPTDFRRVRLLNLEGCMDESNPAYKSYLVKHNSASCL